MIVLPAFAAVETGAAVMRLAIQNGDNFNVASKTQAIARGNQTAQHLQTTLPLVMVEH